MSIAYRDKPSTKARENSYTKLRFLMYLLDKLNISSWWYKNLTDTKDLKSYMIKHTPPEKRGFTDNPRTNGEIRRHLDELYKK